MIVAFYLEDMSNRPMGEFFESMAIFARTKFDIKLSDTGEITINGDIAPTSYSLGEGKNDYTPEEAYREFVRTPFFSSYAKSRFYTVYKTEQII